MKSPVRAVRPAAIATALGFGLTFCVPAIAAQETLKKGTDVHLIFDSSLSSKTAHVGDKVLFHVADPVEVDGKTVIAEGTKVSGTVEGVHGRGRYGVNARVQLNMSSVRSVTGSRIPLEPKTKGNSIGSRTGDAAAATAGSAIVLGPIGLAAGLFVVGKNVNAHPGDKATVEVARDTTVKVK